MGCASRYDSMYLSPYSSYSDSCIVYGALFSMTNRWSIFLKAEARRSASISLTIDLQQTQVSEPGMPQSARNQTHLTF